MKQIEDFPPMPKWKPNLLIDIDLVYEKAKYYTNGKMQFVVFEKGTVAYLPERVDNIEESAKLLLDKVFHFHPDFDTLTMDDENYLVTYSQTVFTVVFKEEVETHWNYIDENHQDGVCPDEVLLNAQGQTNVFDTLGKIGLFGRTKMFMDAQCPKIIKIFDPFEENSKINGKEKRK
jgi:hypothetical protein